MSHDLVADFARWVAAEDVRLVGMALISVVLVWLSEKARMVRMDRYRWARGHSRDARTRMERMTPSMPRSPREALNDSMA
ncbi:hypothetical protein [Pendulispora albinea]|uniref:Uncharacterized protein n=1 Tax=Pendulispora albinea TaxID=2741071 RepID=A0ABZ2MAW1_9BACT